jgi:hypothetical protein
VVWELNAVGEADEGSTMAPGSHKANFVTPASMLQHDSPTMQGYTCPAGSLVIFTEVQPLALRAPPQRMPTPT